MYVVMYSLWQLTELIPYCRTINSRIYNFFWSVFSANWNISPSVAIVSLSLLSQNQKQKFIWRHSPSLGREIIKRNCIIWYENPQLIWGGNSENKFKIPNTLFFFFPFSPHETKKALAQIGISNHAGAKH